ncbi:Ectopic P granules protein 5 [Homalodisca vitripennis]|nr:Ectopic P granules protein 5 [Homalodisca vitripennis]
MFGGHFTKERLQYGLYGLYPKYRVYIEPLSIFQGMIGHALVVATLQNDRGSLSDKLCEQLWPHLCGMFSPWLAPYFTRHLTEPTAAWIQQLTDDRSVLPPWIVADGGHANKMASMFVECIRFVVDTLPVASSNMLSCVWQFYVTNFAHNSIKDYILSVMHGNLISLPWQRFFPTLQDIDLMLKRNIKWGTGWSVHMPDGGHFTDKLFTQVIDIMIFKSDGQLCCSLWRLRAHSSHVIVASPPARIYFRRVIDTVPFKKLNGFKGPKWKIKDIVIIQEVEKKNKLGITTHFFEKKICLQVVDQYLPDCHTFLGAVFIEVPWYTWVAHSATQESSRAHASLLHLLIKLANEPNVRQISSKGKQVLLSATDKPILPRSPLSASSTSSPAK